MLGVKTTKTDSYLRRSRGILNLFTKTMGDLADINKSMHAEHEELTVLQEEIQANKDLLSEEMSHNAGIISKMRDFFSTT